VIPDFRGNWDALNTVLATKPDVLNHNTETVPRLLSPGAQRRFVREVARVAAALEGSASGSANQDWVDVRAWRGKRRSAVYVQDLAAQGTDILTLGRICSQRKSICQSFAMCIRMNLRSSRCGAKLWDLSTSRPGPGAIVLPRVSSKPNRLTNKTACLARISNPKSNFRHPLGSRDSASGTYFKVVGLPNSWPTGSQLR